jgi:hypothetical protein
MLSFLKHKQDAASSAPVDVIKRPSDSEEDTYDVLESAAEDLMHAMKANDVKGVCAALRAAFELCDSEPHEEGPHE